MSLEIDILSGTYIDESPGLQTTDGKQDIALAGVPLAVQTAFSSAGAALADAIEIAGGGGSDVTVTGNTNGLSLVDSNGEALDGEATGIFTHDGEEIFLYSAGSNVVLGRRGDGGADPAGDVIFAIYLEETGFPVSGGRFWIAQFEAINHPDTTDHDDFVDLTGLVYVAGQSALEFDFAGAPSGNNAFMAFGDVGGTAIIATGRTAELGVNSSQGGGDTTLGTKEQDIRAGQGMFFTYANEVNPDFLVPDLTSTEASDANNIDFQSLA
jgi:hypothetical protein